MEFSLSFRDAGLDCPILVVERVLGESNKDLLKKIFLSEGHGFLRKKVESVLWKFVSFKVNKESRDLGNLGFGNE